MQVLPAVSDVTILTDLFRRIVILLVLCCVVISASSYATGYENETAIIFEANNGEKVSAFQGWVWVPENRQKADSRSIKVNYVRFPALDKRLKGASPVVYLSGGPGGSGVGTAKRQRFPLFMAMREFGDVIALDQRGIDEGRLPCESNQKTPHDEAIDDARYTNLHKLALKECLSVWKDKGIDIHGYTTQESAFDLDTLRRHLKAEKLTLWGISYGSHLALAALKTMNDRIERVVLASVEGLDQTIKMPARTDRYFTRLQTAINQDEFGQELGLKERYPDIKVLIRDVHTLLDKAPLKLDLIKEGQTVPIVFQKRDMQGLASGLIADPQRALMLLDLYQGIQAGNTEPLAALLSKYTDPLKPISFYGMSVAMDIASGISQGRYEQVRSEVKIALLADKLNFGLDHFGDIPGIDLGESFRSAPKSDVPVLVLSGTLDGRTYVESQAEAVRGLKNVTIVKVENAGHNLFMSSTTVTETIQAFMRDKPIKKNTIKADLVPAEN